MAANTPPKPHTEGMELTNTETGIKYQFSVVAGVLLAVKHLKK